MRIFADNTTIMCANFASMKATLTIIAFILASLECCAQFNTIGRVSNRKIATKEQPSSEHSNEEIGEKVKDSLSIYHIVDSISSMYVAYPLQSIHIGSGYGLRKHPITHKLCLHNGIDLQAKYEAVFSMLPGMVIHVGEDARSGKYVTIQTMCYSISYCHLYKQYVSFGEYVIAGQMIAQSGNTGWSTGPHLHLTTKKDGQAFNPTILLDVIQSVRKKQHMME